ncbi:hypothetical protein M413DRAFT_31565 [Hebeloma cylindrosporum]|uniref:F-box domain-containing protein n=1 Tax=Hebeloma cylindrosporum TaxID=76867 RepID=A0A0C2Y635_HEBCY|nr:hypothetical protein M413DRAFT_31565 [Hebeloma cylindrosporum h7]
MSMMPITRAAAKSVRPSSKVDAHADESYDESEFSDEALSDEDSDYDNGRKTAKPPPVKKAKKESDKQASVKTSRQKKCLSLLPAMPLDVLFEVFSHLDPKDIIHLARTNRIFRDTLVARSATFLWKAARERYGAPECPFNVSEPQWAVLLFESNCQVRRSHSAFTFGSICGAKNIPKPDFGLLRRVCVNCKKSNLLVKSRFKNRFPGVDPEILDLIPSTNVGAWSHGHARDNRFFWIPDIKAISLKLAKYQKNVDLRRLGAKQALKDFKAQRVKMVTSIHKLADEGEDWYHEFSRGRHQDKLADMDQRLKSIQSKFRELGYQTSDMEHLRWKSECQQPTLLTDRIWKRIRPILEPTVLQKKRERLERDMPHIRAKRRAIVHSFYQEYQKTLSPSQWKCLPGTLEICAMGPFAEVLDANAKVPPTAASFEDAFRQLPELLAAYSDAREQNARSLLKIRSQSAEGSTASASSSNSSHPDMLDLATAVFICKEARCVSYGSLDSYLFGWDDIAQHHCKPDINSVSIGLSWFPQRVEYVSTPQQISFTPQGSTVAAAVVRAAGLDERVATASDMDERDLRFACSACRPSQRGSPASWRESGYKWRDFVSHYRRSFHTRECVPVVLSPVNMAAVKESEMADPNRSKSRWTCGHCSVHLGDFKSRDLVVEHLKSVHGIDSPREPEDLFFFDRDLARETFQASYLVEPPVKPSE